MKPLKLLLSSNVRVFVYATGAGAGFQKQLWNIPGASSYLVGAEFPYKMEKTAERLGFTPEHYVSEETSIELAMKAYMEAYDPKEKPGNVIGIGLTGSVASLKEHRGEHRVFATAISNDSAYTYSITIEKRKGKRARSIDGIISDGVAAHVLLRLLGSGYLEMAYADEYVMSCNEKFHSNEELINLIMQRPYLKANGTRGPWVQPRIESRHHGFVGDVKDETIASPYLLFAPGTYNPFHYGHEAAAEAAKGRRISDMCQNVDLIYTTCINPLHKPPAKATDLLQKISQMRGRNFLLTKDDGLFLDKARNNPNAGFVLGADALLTMLNPKWYKEPEDVEKMLDELDNLNVKFYIVGRLVDGEFITLKDIQKKYPNIINHCFLFSAVPGRWDISSTELRNKL